MHMPLGQRYTLLLAPSLTLALATVVSAFDFRCYRQRFMDYPDERRALIPFV